MHVDVHAPAAVVREAPAWRTLSLAAPAPVRSPTLAVAESLVGTSPAYASLPDWCAYLVEDVLARAHAGLSLYDGSVRETGDPVPGDAVELLLPSLQGDGWVAHVGVLVSLDRDWVLVVNGNGSSPSAVTYDRYLRRYVTSYLRTR